MDSREQIEAALNSSEEEVRLQGLRALAASESARSFDLVSKALADDSWRVRKDAVDLFMRFPADAKLIDKVIKLLYAEDNAGLRNAAVEILTRMGRKSVPQLLEQTDCSDHDVRKFVVDILGDIADPSAIPALTQALEDKDSNVRAAAAENLGKLKVKEAVPDLLGAMRHPDLLLQFTILDALGRISAPVPFSELLPYKDEKLLRKALVDCLGKTGDASAVDELVTSLVDDMRNVREAALLGLVDIFRRYPEAVRERLAACDIGSASNVVSEYLDEECSDNLKLASIRVLGWLGAEDAVMSLLQLLGYESLQQETLLALVDIGVANPEALLKAWDRVSDDQRAYLAYIMGEARCVAALPCLQDGLADPDPQLKRMSAHSLGRLGVVDMLPALVESLQSEYSDVQEAVTQALVSLGTQFPDETFAILKPLLGHSEPTQRMLAVLVIRELDTPAVVDALGMSIKDPAVAVRRAAVKVFERCELSDHISTLLLSLTDEDAEVRRTVVDILGNCADEQALDGLQLALQDEDIWVRAAAVRGIGRIGGSQSKSLVKLALSDEVGLVSIAALETLAELLGSEACAEMVTALEHPDEEVVTAAMNLLARHCSTDWLKANVDYLINHSLWGVRAHIARIAVELLGADASSMLQERLKVETDDLVRQQLTELISGLTGR